MNKILILLLSLCAFACRSQQREVAPPQRSAHTLRVNIDCPAMRTKLLDPAAERAVRDINLYLFHAATGVPYHVYSAAPAGGVSLEVLQGSYTLYAVANAGMDMGMLPRERVEGAGIAIGAESELESRSTLMMGARQEITVERNAQVAVMLTRATTRINLTVDPSAETASRIRILSVQARSVPRSATFFADNRPPAAGEVMDYARREVNGNRYQGGFYMLENAQGVNAAIADPRHRNRPHAPVRATWVHIEALFDGDKTDYAVYLGENATSDFNV